MKKILMITTGGTIASVNSEKGLVPILKSKDLEEISLNMVCECKIECIDLMNVDSTNINVKDWQRIARTIEKNYSSYDGFVITHGTDTMAYTASALFWMLCNLNKAVILTGSQLPILDPKTDAKDNLCLAIETACSKKGVWIAFGKKVIRGDVATKAHTTDFEAFKSVVEINCAAKKVTGEFYLAEKLETKVFPLKLVPGIDPKIIDYLIEERYKGIVIEAFGLGGIPNRETENLLPALKKAIAKGIKVLITSQCKFGDVDLSVYEVGVKALALGVNPAFKLSFEAAYTKLMWEIANKQVEANKQGEVNE
jgi:L-asparaginase